MYFDTGADPIGDLRVLCKNTEEGKKATTEIQLPLYLMGFKPLLLILRKCRIHLTSIWNEEGQEKVYSTQV